MADKKISALTASTTPLAGTEVLPIVQGGSTVKVSVANLTDGRVVTASNLGVNVASPANRVDVDDGGVTVRFSGQPTLALSNAFMHIVGNPAGAGGFRLGVGWNVGIDGTNWRTGGDGGNNGGGYIAGNYGDGALDFYTVPNVGGSSQTISDATFGTLKRMRISSTGDVTAYTGNFVLGTAGKGIDFSANGGDVLTQYDEGTWAIADLSGAGLTLTVDHAKYTRVGNLVTVSVYVTYPVTVSAANATLSLPAALSASAFDIGTAGASNGAVAYALTVGGTNAMTLRNANLVTLTNAAVSGANVLISFTYMV